MTASDSDLTFQIISASARDVYPPAPEEGGPRPAPIYTITLFGATAAGKSVSLDITGFEPYFFVEIPDDWKSSELAAYQRHLLAATGFMDPEREAVTFTTERHRSFWDFTNNRLFTFLRVQARTKKLWTRLRDVTLDPDRMIPQPLPLATVRPRAEGVVTLRVFEANIDPMLRFFHERELKPAGWATVPDGVWEESETGGTIAAIQATCEWDYVSPAPPAVQLTLAPLRVMSWDIECTSSHGDFPLAIKTWRKPARELVAAKIVDLTEVAAAITAAVLGDSATCPISRVYLGAEGPREVATGLPAVLTAWPALAHAISTGAEDAIDKVEALLNQHLPPPLGDPIIQIGCVLYVNGVAQRKDIFVLGSCSRLPTPTGGAPVHTHACANEATLIRVWCRLIGELDPDIMVGYNIFGFDEKYLWDRATVNRCTEALKTFSRFTGRKVELKEKQLSSSAMGDNKFYVITGDGRLHIDLLAYVRRNAVLDSYSLDNVTATFMSGAVLGAPTPTGQTRAEDGAPLWRITTKSTKGTIPGRFVVIMDEENDLIGDKLEVVAVEPKALIVAMPDGGAALAEHGPPPCRWSQSKDDVSPKDIFRLHARGPADRAKVARYCIQDCDLVIELLQKLEVLNNSIAMANVCWVPVEYIFTRGQGIKSESLVFYECRKEGQLIPVLPAPPRPVGEAPADTDCAIAEVPEVIVNTDDMEGYEGAIVLNPLSGIYLDNDPVAALDFSSLYPSTIISENLSHDSLVWVKDYSLSGEFVQLKEGSDTYDNLPGWEYLEVEYDILRPDPAQSHKKHPDLIPSGKRVCRYAQPPDGSKSTLPKILMMLLKQRKVTRNLAAAETDEFRAALLDAQQLAYKLTANSLYGQLGSNTSKIRRKCVAASTTGHGRQQLLFSKACIERAYGPTAGDPRCSAVCVYGDTDSVFIAFRPKDPTTGVRLTGRPAQEAAKALAEEAGHKISGALKPPHDFEFDKMFRCFCLLSKKRYVGDMTEGGLEDSDYHRKSMGIVMKRRDNAPIVKYVYGGAIEAILVRRDIRAAFEFVRAAARDLLAGKFGLKRLTITKSLRAEYKAVPAHKILADRIGKRDPGNKPASNDRIPFVYVAPPRGKKAPDNQGERIETPSYIVENSLKPDYAFYITNQIAKPVSQVFGLVVDQLPGVKRHQLEAAARAKDPVAAREALAENLLFGDLLSDAKREASGVADIRSFFTVGAKPKASTLKPAGGAGSSE
jgi:DNA polymerase elongation subunit (family B)